MDIRKKERLREAVSRIENIYAEIDTLRHELLDLYEDDREDAQLSVLCDDISELLGDAETCHFDILSTYESTK